MTKLPLQIDTFHLENLKRNAKIITINAGFRHKVQLINIQNMYLLYKNSASLKYND